MKKRKSSPSSLDMEWTPFYRCAPDDRDPGAEIWKNSRYQVHVKLVASTDTNSEMLHLSFKRLDQKPHIPYRDKMRIKSELISPEWECVELYPARSREVDTANQYHMWGYTTLSYRFPFGFSQRAVSEVSSGGAVQSPFAKDERPSDLLDKDAVNALVEQYKKKTHAL